MVRLVGDVFASCAGSLWDSITIIGVTNRVNSIEFGGFYPSRRAFIRILAGGISHVSARLIGWPLQLVTGSDGLDGVNSSASGLDGNGRYLNGAAAAGLFPGAVSFYFNDAVLTGLFPGAVSIDLNDASIANTLPGAVSSYLNDVGRWVRGRTSRRRP